MKVRRLKVGTLEIPLDELEAEILEVGVLRIVRNDGITEMSLTSSPGVVTRYVFELTHAAFPPNRFVLPGGSASEASGTAVFSVLADGTGKLSISVEGLRKINTEGGYYEGWLIHDLMVPGDLSPGDLAALPHGPDGCGNQPGGLYTVDGLAPSVGSSGRYMPNTIWIPVSTGVFNTDDDGKQAAPWDYNSSTNWTFSLLELIGLSSKAVDTPDLPRDPDNRNERRHRLIPSGVARNILTDVFMRSTSVHPELTLTAGFPKRLAAIFCDHLKIYDNDGDGGISLSEVEHRSECFLAPDDFSRMAITRELNDGLIGPRFMPSYSAFVLGGIRA